MDAATASSAYNFFVVQKLKLIIASCYTDKLIEWMSQVSVHITFRVHPLTTYRGYYYVLTINYNTRCMYIHCRNA